VAELRIERLTKRFGATIALEEVSLTVFAGEVVALLGPSGCGKTTLLRCIAGLEHPTSGRVEIGGDVLFSPTTFVPPARRNIAMVFQSYALWPHMSVWENVTYGLRVQKFPKDLTSERAAEVLQLLGLSHLAGRYPSQLSGGQQQRVAVARALALRADVVLFDEPLSNLDLRLRETVRTELRRVLKQLGQTAVYVTHDIGEAVVVADRIVMMSTGNIVQVGSPEAVYHTPRTRYVAQFVGNTNIIPAHVKRDGTAVRLGVGDDLTFCASRTVGAVPPDADSVQLMIRPEYVEISAGADVQGISATLIDVEFIGQVTALTVRVGETTLRAITLSRPSVRLTPGATCRIRIADENVVVLPAAGTTAGDSAAANRM
jgi:ABC-type Fe3+/spermidine/putrescine transport system ATPase subunit